MEKYLQRALTPPSGHFFLLGPRGTGKSTYLRHYFPNAVWVDLLKPDNFTRYNARPELLEELIKGNKDSGEIIIDEIQRIPELLNVVHRLIEMKLGPRFILTGSSARKLRTAGTNLLAGRAIVQTMHPFLLSELDDPVALQEVLTTGLIPIVRSAEEKIGTLRTYVSLYIQQEVLHEALIRNSGDFGRFLEVLSFSHGSILNVSNIARNASVPRNTVNSYLRILEDILLGYQIQVFTKRAARKLTSHPKFYFFDVGVFTAIRPSGPLDAPEEIAGPALEGLLAQHLRALIAYEQSDAGLFYWRSRGGVEVDFVLYGTDIFLAIEVKNSVQVRTQDIRGLKEFRSDYPEATCICLYRGEQRFEREGILFIPIMEFLDNLVPGKPII